MKSIIAVMLLASVGQAAVAPVSWPIPSSNDFTHFEWGEEITSGLRALQEGLDGFRPNLCLLLGATALRAAKGYSESITNWRGSLFIGGENTPFAGRKCLATYHPASALRVYEETSLLLFGLKWARTEGESPDLVLPGTQITAAQTTEDPRANTLREKRAKVSRFSVYLLTFAVPRAEKEQRAWRNRRKKEIRAWWNARRCRKTSPLRVPIRYDLPLLHCDTAFRPIVVRNARSVRASISIGSSLSGCASTCCAISRKSASIRWSVGVFS